MHAIIEPTATALHCHLDGADASLRLDRADALARLQAWGERCGQAMTTNDDAALLAIGRELHAWLDTPAWISQWARDEAVQRLEIRAPEPAEPLAAALLACPWEFIADEQGFIAATRATPLHIIRVRGEASADDIEAAARAVARRSEADAIAAAGQLDEALEILRGEVLSVFERLEDSREKAITQGRIADVLLAAGQLDEAMALQQERLPVVTALGDPEGLAHIRYSMANIRLARGEHESGNLQQIYEELTEAFQISCQQGHPDAVGGIGLLLVQVLAMGGLRDEAIETLDTTEDAFTTLRDLDGLAQVKQLRQMLGI